MCTIDTIQYHMNHSFKALQDKLYMASRWDMSPFHPCEHERAARAGTELPIRGAMCEYRGDLPERCQRAGVKTQQGFYGCLSCMEQSCTIHDRVAEVTLATSPWTPRTEDNYFEELLTHLVAVSVATAAEKQLLIAALESLAAYPWGRVVNGNKGAPWRLAAGDRLVVPDLITTVHDLELLIPPFQLYFFRPRKQSGLVGVSIMWDVPGVPGSTCL